MNAMTVAEFAQRISVSRSSAYELIAAGAIEPVNVAARGKRPALRITDKALEQFLAKRVMHRSTA